MDVHPPKNGINRYWSIAIFYNDEHISWSFLEACHDRCLSLSGQAGQAPLAAPRRGTSRIASCKSSGRADFQWQTFPASVWPTKTNHSMALEFLQFVALKRLYLKFIRLSVFPQIIFPEINQHIYVCYIYIYYYYYSRKSSKIAGSPGSVTCWVTLDSQGAGIRTPERRDCSECTWQPEVPWENYRKTIGKWWFNGI